MQADEESQMVSMQPNKEETVTLLTNSGCINADDVLLYTPPQERFLHNFPHSIERVFEPFDDAVLAWVQKVYNQAMFWIDMIITGLFAIEISFVAPFVLFIVGLDGLATEFAYLSLILAFISQIPKRFLWRFRPYMRKKDTTSSFPSRAVTCSVVYSYAAAYAYTFYSDYFVPEWWMFVLLVLAVLLSSFARVNLGVHYPSDCIAGVIQGVIVCAAGTALWKADMLGCASCHAKKCYTADADALSFDRLQDLDFKAMGITLGVSVLLMVISVIKPIHFWGKCDRVYGMILPAILFQVGFLCPRSGSPSLAYPDTPPWFTYPFAAGLVALVMGVSLKANGKYPFIVFAFLYILIFFSITFWRLKFV